MSDQIFSEFLTFCEEYLQDTDELELKKLMIKRYNDCNHDFKVSSDFSDLVLITRAKIDSDSSRVFVHLRDFLGELKAYRNKKDKKKGTKRVRDSGLSDIETPSPKSVKGDNSESSSDEKVCKPIIKHEIRDRKLDPDSCVESKDKSEKPLLVNGIHENSDDVTVLEVASQSDDDCVMVIDDDDDVKVDRDVKDGSNKIADKDSNKSQGQSKSDANAFQEAFQNFTNHNTPVLDDSEESKSKSELQNDKENVAESSELSAESESDSLEESKSALETSQIENSESDYDVKKSDSVSVNNSVSKNNETKRDNEEEPVSGTFVVSDSSVESPKPSTSSDYKIPENVNLDETDDSCILDSVSLDSETCHKMSDTADEDAEINSKNGATDSKQNGEVETNDNKSLPDTPEQPTKTKKASKRQIRRLEQLLEDIRDQIENLKEKELSLDDLNDDESAYVLEDKYQKKFVKVWNKLCELKGRAETTGRPTERRFMYTGTRYPEINRKIERFINKWKVFPDYGDIHNIIAKVNTKQGLGIKGPRVDQLARETFADVGNRLQKRRKEDLNITFLGHLTRNSNFQQTDDPALKDPDLKKTLEENKKISKTKIEEIINKYADKQRGDDTEDPENDENPEDNDDEDGEEEAEENEDIEVPEINHIIDDISDEEEGNEREPKPVVMVTPTKAKKDIDEPDSDTENKDSSSENEESVDELYKIDKEVKVVVTDIMKFESPYKYGLDALVKESKDIVIETDVLNENFNSNSQEPIEIDEDDNCKEDNKNEKDLVTADDTVSLNGKEKTRNLMAEFTKMEEEERSKSVSPELRSKIDSLVTDLMDEESQSSVNNDPLEVKSRSISPELNLKITSVRHIDDLEMFNQDEPENDSSHSELFYKNENKNQQSAVSDDVQDENEKCADNFETISVDSSGNDSDDNSSFSKMACVDEEHKTVQDDNDTTFDPNGDNNDSDSSKSSHKTSHNYKIITSKVESSTSNSSSSIFSCKSVNSELDNTDNDHAKIISTQDPSDSKSSHIEPSKLLNRIVSLAKNKFKLNRSEKNQHENHVTKICNPKNDVIEIDDSDEENVESGSAEIKYEKYDQAGRDTEENVDDDDDSHDSCIILSDSD